MGLMAMNYPAASCGVIHLPTEQKLRHNPVERTGGKAMPVIDVQVHPFDRNHPGRPWASPSHGLDSATGEEMVAAMTRVGVDGAILVSSFSAYEAMGQGSCNMRQCCSSRQGHLKMFEGK